MSDDIKDVSISEIRPRFDGRCEKGMDELLSCLQLALDQEDAPCSGKIGKSYWISVSVDGRQSLLVAIFCRFR